MAGGLDACAPYGKFLGEVNFEFLS